MGLLREWLLVAGTTKQHHIKQKEGWVWVCSCGKRTALPSTPEPIRCKHCKKMRGVLEKESVCYLANGPSRDPSEPTMEDLAITLAQWVISIEGNIGEKVLAYHVYGWSYGEIAQAVCIHRSMAHRIITNLKAAYRRGEENGYTVSH